MRPSNKGAPMTSESSDWWPSHRENVLRRSTYIILRGPRKDDASFSTKGEQHQMHVRGKVFHSSRSMVTSINSPEIVKVAPKSKTLKRKGTQVDCGVGHPLLTPKEAAAIASDAIDVTLKRKKPCSSLDKTIENSPSIVPFCRDTSKPSASANEDGITSVASCSNESNVSQEQHWKRLKKKP
ncbi:uncharacterized protein LOC129888291 [Solanum dulcamara]|uniref:uncharacterized protein LOC129888291 n=1 Tax=Solanum dulcamara TaxID=45834 RepID=UPI002484F807|nr:uncharacterized protein LOC129888291 [Solanum dulcamara]